MNSNSGNHYPISSLYVGDLDPDVSEAALFEKFAAVGPVLSIRVCRDIISRRSLGYAYVNYQNAGDAELAIDTLNFEKINGRPIRIMWSQRDPSLRRSGVGNIFIKNLDKDVDNKVLFDTFSIFGNILSCKVSYDEKGVSKGYAFVHYDSEEAAQDAIETYNSKNIQGKKIYVGKFLSRSERESKHGGSRRFTNVYVKNLNDEYDTNDKLQKLFEPFGEITSALVVKDDDGKSKGFGFVCFSSAESAENAVKELNGKDMGNNKQLYVGRAQKKAEREAELKRKVEHLKLERFRRSQGVNLYVKNLEDCITDEILQKEFSVHGTITSAKVMTDEKGRSKGFGFVCFSTPEEATKAVTSMNNLIIATKPLYVALAQRKEEREAQKLNIRAATRLLNPTNLAAAQQIAFGQNPTGATLATIPGIQGQPVHGAHTATAQPYLVPIAPNPNMHQRNYYPGTGPNMPQNQRVRWNNNTNALNRSNQVATAGGQFMQNNRGGPGGIQRSAAGGQQPNLPRQNVFQPNVQNVQAGAAPPPRPFGPGGAPIPQNTGGPALPTAVRGGPRPAGNIPIPRGGKPPGQQQPGQPMSQMPFSHVFHPNEDRNQIFGDRLYPLVMKLNPEMASKITGMLLELQDNEVIHIIDNPDSLKSKVDEAIKVLQAYNNDIKKE